MDVSDTPSTCSNAIDATREGGALPHVESRSVRSGGWSRERDMADALRLVAAGSEFAFSGDKELTIGRGPDNDIQLSSPYVSGRHGKLVPCAEGWVYEDTRSRNGTYHAGNRIERLVLIGPVTLLLGRPGRGEELHIHPRPRSSIFICYRRGDSGGHAGRLRDQLAERFGDSRIFRDIERLPVGEDFVDAITRTLDHCRVMLVVIGRDWLTATDKHGLRRIDDPSDPVRLEIVTALRKSPAATVIPVLVQGAQMPEAEELPDDLRPLARRGASIAPDELWQPSTDRLVTALEELLVSAAPAAPDGALDRLGPEEAAES